MLDQELRARAAGIVRAHASLLSCSPGSEPGVIAETRALADALEAEPAREVELAEALRELLDAIDSEDAPFVNLIEAADDARPLLEGVERMHAPDDLQPVRLCGRCMAGEGGECHTPGCALWMNRAPDIPVNADSAPERTHALVPLGALDLLADYAAEAVRRDRSSERACVDLDRAAEAVKAAHAAARGERAEWPAA